MIASAFVVGAGVDYDALHRSTKRLVVSLNHVWSRTVGVRTVGPSASSRQLSGPTLALGVHGLHDVLLLLGIPFESARASEISNAISDTVMHAALEASTDVSRTTGHFSDYYGSNESRGRLHIDLAGGTPLPRWNWVALRQDIARFGTRNPAIIALFSDPFMCGVAGCSDTVNPVERYVPCSLRRACFLMYCCSFVDTYELCGVRMLRVNKLLVRTMMKRGLWSMEARDAVIEGGGVYSHRARSF